MLLRAVHVIFQILDFKCMTNILMSNVIKNTYTFIKNINVRKDNLINRMIWGKNRRYLIEKFSEKFMC